MGGGLPEGRECNRMDGEGKGEEKGGMKWTQDVGNRHHSGRGADGAALSGRAFINNARGGPVGVGADKV